MADNIIMIELQVGMDSLDTAIEKLELLGVIDKKTAADFKAASQDSNKFNESLKTTSTATAGVTESIKKMGQEIKTVPKKILDKGAEDSLNQATKATERLSTQVRRMKNELSVLEEQGKRNTAEYRRIAVAAAQLEDQIGDTSQTIRILASDTKYTDALISGVQGVAGAFAVAQGAVALFGDENEDLQKTLLKVNAAMAIVQGLSAVQLALNKDSAASVVGLSLVQSAYNVVVGTTTGLMKGLRIALAATGIGAIALGIYAAVQAFQRWNAEQKLITADARRMEEVNEKAVESYAQQAAELTALVRVVQSSSSTYKDKKRVLEEVNEKYGDQIGRFKSVEDLEKRFIERAEAMIAVYKLRAQAQAALNLATEEYQKKLVAQNEGIVDSMSAWEKTKTLFFALTGQAEKARDVVGEAAEDQRQVVNQAEQDFNAYIDLYSQFQSEAMDIVDKYNFDVVQGQKKVVKETQTAAQALSAALTAMGEALGKGYAAARQKSIDDLNAWVQGASMANETIEEALMSTNEREIEAIDDKYEALLALAQKYKIDNTELLAAWDKEKQDKLQEQADKEVATEQEKTDAILEQRRRIYEYTVATAQEIASLVTQFSQQQMDEELANLQEQLDHKLISQEQYEQKVKIEKRKAAAVNKVVAGFNVVIDTAQSIVKTGAELGYPAAIPFQVLAGIIGAAQLALIAGQKVPGFAVGTKSAPAGFKWVGEQGPELIGDGGGYPIITAHESKELAGILGKYDIPYMPGIPDVPNYDGMAAMMAAGMAIPAEGMDYDKLAKAMARNPQPIVNINENGFTTYLMKRNAMIQMLNKTYSSN